MRILSLAIEYPNSTEPELGLFVRSRLQAIAGVSQLTVVAPVALFSYSSPRSKWLRGRSLPVRKKDKRLHVLHPRWLYPPFGTPLNVICLFLATIRPVLTLRKRFSFDIIDAHFGYPDGVCAALLASVVRRPFIVTLRGNEPMFARWFLRRLCLRWALKRASRVVAVSEDLRRFAVSLGVGSDRTKTIGNGIDGSLFFSRDRASCRAEYAILPEQKVVLSVGSLIERKGHHRTIRAVKELVEEGMAVQLIIAGTATREQPRFAPELQRLVAELDLARHVRFVGWTAPQDLPELYSAADVFCLASDAEGWPNVVHEALSCGLPVVATGVGAVPDLIASDHHGSVTPVHNQEALTEALRRALQRDWDRNVISNWGRSRTWDQVASDVIDLMREVLKESGQKPSGAMSILTDHETVLSKIPAQRGR